MKALVFEAKGRASLEDLEVPEPGNGEVLVRSRFVGICHSDFELLSGDYIIPFQYPIIPGHEWSGEIAELGEGVSGFSVGDRVVGECVVGPGGRDHFGFSISGAAAEYFIARAEWLHAIPETMSFETGALVEPFSVAYNATCVSGIDPSDRVAVLGGGPIGLLSAMAALGRGSRVVVVEPREDRRRMALEIGAHAAVDPTELSTLELAEELTDGDLFDVVLETAGHPSAMAQALSLAGNHGRIVYVGINIGGVVKAPLGLIQAKSLSINGIVGSVGVWPEAIRFLASGVIDPTVLVTQKFSLDCGLDALSAASLGTNNIKVHIEVGK